MIINYASSIGLPILRFYINDRDVWMIVCVTVVSDEMHFDANACMVTSTFQDGTCPIWGLASL
jgi:hypothetical protein